jgi:hypothetical protein
VRRREEWAAGGWGAASGSGAHSGGAGGGREPEPSIGRTQPETQLISPGRARGGFGSHLAQSEAAPAPAPWVYDPAKDPNNQGFNPTASRQSAAQQDELNGLPAPPPSQGQAQGGGGDNPNSV